MRSNRLSRRSRAANRIRLWGIALLPLLIAGCIHSHHGHHGHHPGPAIGRPGPPPHAPAHGHRHKHGDTQLVFDSDLHVYVVVDLADHYFYDGWYFRLHDGRWTTSVSIRGPWTVADFSSVPERLQAKYHGKNGKKKGKPAHARGRGHGPPARHR